MSWKKIYATDQVPHNSLKKFDVDGIAVIVANYGDGFRVFPPFCPHMEEPLAESGMLEDGLLTCSKHLWQWDMRTMDMLGMAEKPLLSYDVKCEGDNVMANMESELIYNYGEEDDMDDDDFFNAD